MGFTIGIWLLLLGLGLALVAVFAWRSDTLTGVIGVVLSVPCAAWLLRTIQEIDSHSTWSESPMPRTYYYVLVAACGIAALTCAYYIVRGVICFVRSRRRARAVVPEQPHDGATKTCPYCGGTVPAQAIACKHCERDLYQRG